MASDDLLDNMSPEEAAKSEPLKSAVWLEEIKAAEKNLEKWHEQGRRINKRFLDKREDQEEKQNKVNLFTTNTGILVATLYARFPKPSVSREFDDQDDDVARVAAIIMERMLKIRARDDVDSAMKAVVQDRLVPGAGVVWARYEPTIQKAMSAPVLHPETGATIQEPQEYEKIVDERVCVDYVFWEDFLWSPARTWEQVRWVGRRVKMNRPDATKRFGEKIAAQLSYKKDGATAKDSAVSVSGEAPDNDEILYATIYEIWDKRTKMARWVSPGFDLQLDQKPDPLKLDGFWPCPKPLFALTSTSNLVPRPDYLMAQDQYEELDSVNNRITWLEKAIKVVGVYDGTNAEIERIFLEAVDLKIIPSRSFAEFMEKGGFKGAIDWLPLDVFVLALDKLRSVRQDLIAQIYEITGISDIMRGASKASETLGAQQLKAQYGSVKLQFIQMEVAGFLEELLEIKANIIREFFQPETMLRESNIMNTPDAEFAQQAIALIKGPEYQMRVEVQADSMAVPEYNAERDDRMNFIRAIAEMMKSAAPLLEQVPDAGVIMLKVIQWGAASFKTGVTIEGVLDKAIKAIEKDAKTPKGPPPPDPDIALKKDLEMMKQAGEDGRAKLASDTQVQIKQMDVDHRILIDNVTKALDLMTQRMDQMHEATQNNMDRQVAMMPPPEVPGAPPQ